METRSTGGEFAQHIPHPNVDGAHTIPTYSCMEWCVMDFRIEPAHPDGICVRVEFWVETWEDIPKLMRRLQEADAEV